MPPPRSDDHVRYRCGTFVVRPPLVVTSAYNGRSGTVCCDDSCSAGFSVGRFVCVGGGFGGRPRRGGLATFGGVGISLLYG